MKPKFIDFA